jgi:putative spermidine/putrescine transport system permease protein
MATNLSAAPQPRSVLTRLSTGLYTRPWLLTGLLFALPLFYMVVIYLGSLAAMLVNSFYQLDDFSGKIVQEFTLKNYLALLQPGNLSIILRTVSMAAAVTVACALLAFPLAYYMARYASPRAKGLPLPGGADTALVELHRARLCLEADPCARRGGRLAGQPNRRAWLLEGVLATPIIGGPSLSVSFLGMFIAFVYVWLPYMVLPVQAALEKVPQSYLEASADLGAQPGQTFRNVILPLSFPGIVAGSIFTFSLTLGDFVVPQVLGNSAFFIGQAVLAYQGTAGNLPLAAAMTVAPMVIMILYLLGARRLGAFEAL